MDAIAGLAFILFCSVGSIFGVGDESTDILLKNNKLIGTTVSTQGFTLVLTDLKDHMTDSPKEHEVNASLLTWRQRFYTVGYGFDGMRVVDILPSQTKLKVKQVYISRPSLCNSAFAGDSYFAVVEDTKGKQYTAMVFQDRIVQLDDCDNKECRKWKNPLTSMMQSKTTKHKIDLEYYITNTKGHLYKKRPPYPEGMLKRSGAKIVDYLMKKNISIIDNNKHHPNILIQMDFLEYGNLILHSDPLGIKNVGIWE